MATHKLELDTMLTISTAHVSQETMDMLGDTDAEYGRLSNVASYPKILDDEIIGWFIYPCKPADRTDDGMPDDLKAVLELAEYCGANVVCLDCDGPVIEDFPKLGTYVHRA